MNNAQFAQAIKAMCKERCVSISKMLSECKIRKSLIYDLEKRDWTPSLEIAEQIADYLECSIDFLLGRSQKVKTDKVKVDSKEISEEQLLIAAYQQLTDEGQRAVLNYAEMAAKNPIYQKYTDISKEA